MLQRTLCLIKPDAVKRDLAGAILALIQSKALRVVGLKMLHLSPKEAEGFYAVHKERPFFTSLVSYMCSGPLVAVVLEGEDAVVRYRALMGATNPANAEEGTLRKLYALSTQSNSVHGSDSSENAATEIAYFFSTTELVG